MAATSRTQKTETGPRTQQDLEADIEQLKADIAALVKQLQTTGEHSYGTARRAATEGVEQLRAQGEAALAGIRTSADDMERQILSLIHI